MNLDFLKMRSLTMGFNLAQLQDDLTELINEYENDHVSGVIHKKQIDELKELMNRGDLESELEAKNICLMLNEWFMKGARINYTSKENFVNQLNSNLDVPSFYRAIGLIIKAQHIDTIYNSLQTGQLEKDQLLVLLRNLEWQCKKDHPINFLNVVGGGQHKVHLKQLHEWITGLESGKQDVKSTIEDLHEWFISAAQLIWKKDLAVVVNELNSKPKEHTFYRGIGLILRENYKNQSSIYGHIQELIEIKDAKKLQK